MTCSLINSHSASDASRNFVFCGCFWYSFRNPITVSACTHQIRWLTFSRYAGPGSHRYPVGFSGDSIVTWESLNFQPYFTSTASNIGYGWWSHDIGGHMLGYRDNELALRWVQLGVFSPINRLHSSKNEFMGKEPWQFPMEIGEVMKEFLRLRHQMLPYLYTMNYRAYKENTPLILPMYYTYPAEQVAYTVKNEYEYGTAFIVAPVTEKSVQGVGRANDLPQERCGTHPQNLRC